ncbi:MAG: hypothetical protein CMH50_00490 [Myxococcales bacterium]|nr:hypothetical protein [Myxococcales bacterium]
MVHKARHSRAKLILGLIPVFHSVSCGQDPFEPLETPTAPRIEVQLDPVVESRIGQSPKINTATFETDGSELNLEIQRVTATSADIMFTVPTNTAEVYYGIREIGEDPFRWLVEAWQNEENIAYTFAPLDAGRDYAVLVKIRTSNGQELSSNVVEIRTQEQNPTNPLRFLEPQSWGQIPIAWNEIPGASQYQIYRSQRRQDGIDFYNPCPESSPMSEPFITVFGETEAVDEAVEANYFYGYTVVGLTRAGVEVDRLSCRWRASPLAPPVNLQAAGLDDGRLEVTWQPSDHNEGSMHAVWFHIEYRAGQNGINEVVPINQSEPESIFIPSLNREETHFIEVSAYPSISGEGVDDALRFQQMGCQCRDFWSARIRVEVPPF